MYTVEAIPFPEDVRREQELLLGRGAPGPLRLALVSGRAALLIAALASPLFGLAIWLEEPAARGALAGWIGGLLLLLLAVFVALGLGSGRKAARIWEQSAAATRADLAAGRALAHQLSLAGPHLLAEHEHGTLVLCPAGPGRTLCLDLSSVSDDPRLDLLGPGPEIPSRWRWLTSLDGERRYRFSAEGEPIAPRRLEQLLGGYDPELPGDLFELLGSPGDGDVVPQDFSTVEGFVADRLGRRP